MVLGRSICAQSKTAVADQRIIRGRRRGSDNFDDAVGNIAAGFDEEVVAGLKAVSTSVRSGIRGGTGAVAKLLDRDDVGFESLENPDARASALPTAGGDVGRHDAEGEIALGVNVGSCGQPADKNSR